MRYPYIIPGHQYQEQSNLASLPFVKSQSQDEPLDLKELIKYCLMPVPPSSLGTPYGSFSMTNKATILHYLLEDTIPEDLPYPKDELFIQDGMELLHILVNHPLICCEICLQVLDQMVAKKIYLFSADSYHLETLKVQERLRYGNSEKIIQADQRPGSHTTSKCSLQMMTQEAALPAPTRMEWSTSSFKFGKNQDGSAGSGWESP